MRSLTGLLLALSLLTSPLIAAVQAKRTVHRAPAVTTPLRGLQQHFSYPPALVPVMEAPPRQNLLVLLLRALSSH